jgi:hypothetical protein
LAAPTGLKLIWNSHTKNSEVLKAEKYASNDIKDKNICYLYELTVGRRAKVHPLGFHFVNSTAATQFSLMRTNGITCE